MYTHNLADSEAAIVDSGLLKATSQKDMHILPTAHPHVKGYLSRGRILMNS